MKAELHVATINERPELVYMKEHVQPLNAYLCSHADQYFYKKRITFICCFLHVYVVL